MLLPILLVIVVTALFANVVCDAMRVFIAFVRGEW